MWGNVIKKRFMSFAFEKTPHISLTCKIVPVRVSRVNKFIEAPYLYFINYYVFKVDVYSFGVLLCEMCIRVLPDPEWRDQQILMVTSLPLRALIRRCLQSEPEARPNMVVIIEELGKPV